MENQKKHPSNIDVAVLMLFAFFNYMKVYCRIRKNPVGQDKPEEPGASS